MTDVLLEARHVTKRYGSGSSSFTALHDVGVSVARGETLAVVGRSGSGKSTLMHLLALLDTPDEGEILVDGQDVRRMPRRAVNRLRNRRFGFVFQQFFLTPDASVLENVMLPLTIAGVRPAERRRRALETLERFELADKARSRAVDLSGGQKQRVVLSRALVAEPDVVFADEPTGNLDTATGQLVEDELFALNRDRGITLVVVTHDDDLAARCGRRIHLRDGRLDETRDEAAAVAS